MKLIYIYIYIYTYTEQDRDRRAAASHGRRLGCRVSVAATSSQATATFRDFKGTVLSILLIRYLVPRMVVAYVVFSRLAILRIEGCLNSAL